MAAVPLPAGVVTLNTLPSSRPSASLAARVPVSTVSSAPLPAVLPPRVVESSPAATVTLTVAVSVLPPELTV